MNLQNQIELLNVPQDFVRLCNVILSAEHGDDYLSIDDDRPDKGNDGYLKSERRIFAMHCFKRLQNQGLDKEIHSKASSDLKKAIDLKESGRWAVDSWTFLCNYPISEDIAARLSAQASGQGIDASWRGPQYLAEAIQRHPEITDQFPNLQTNEISRQLGSLMRRLDITEAKASTESVQVGVPTSAAEQVALVAQRPKGWEYLLFAGVLEERKNDMSLKLQDHELQYSSRSDKIIAEREAPAHLRRAIRQISRIAETLMQIFQPTVQERAFGPLGVPGDPDRITHLAMRVVGCAEEMLDWSAELRGVQVSSKFQRVFELAAQIASQPVQDVLTFVAAYVEQARQIPTLLAQPRNGPISLNLVLALTVDEDAVARFNDELESIIS